MGEKHTVTLCRSGSEGELEAGFHTLHRQQPLHLLRLQAGRLLSRAQDIRRCRCWRGEYSWFALMHCMAPLHVRT